MSSEAGAWMDSIPEAKAYPLTATPYGFRWGPATIERVASGAELGVVIAIRTETAGLEVRVSPKGRVIRTVEHKNWKLRDTEVPA